MMWHSKPISVIIALLIVFITHCAPNTADTCQVLGARECRGNSLYICGPSLRWEIKQCGAARCTTGACAPVTGDSGVLPEPQSPSDTKPPMADQASSKEQNTAPESSAADHFAKEQPVQSEASAFEPTQSDPMPDNATPTELPSKECRTGERRCAGDSVEICDANAWQRRPCPAGETCQSGQCQPKGSCRVGEQRDCYDGPMGTMGVGTCRKGSQRCNARGQWGTCSGAIKPKAEICNDKDTDCNGKIDDGIKPPCCPKGVFCQRAAGTFFTPTKADTSKEFPLKPPAGTYSRILLTFEVLLKGWNNEPNGKRFTTFWLEHNNKFLDLYGYLIFNKPNTLILRHGFNLKPTQKPKVTKRLTLTPGTVYEIRYEFDTKAKRIKTDISVKGQLQTSLQSTPTIQSIVFTANQTLDLAFSNSGHDPNEPPSLGWEYRNARLVLYP